MEITRNTIVKAKRFVTKERLGLSIFTTEKGNLIIDETIGKDVKFLGGTAEGKAEGFGALRAKFGWN